MMSKILMRLAPVSFVANVVGIFMATLVFRLPVLRAFPVAVFVLLLVGILAAYVFSLLLYAFGTYLEDIHAIRRILEAGGGLRKASQNGRLPSEEQSS